MSTLHNESAEQLLSTLQSVGDALQIFQRVLKQWETPARATAEEVSVTHPPKSSSMEWEELGQKIGTRDLHREPHMTKQPLIPGQTFTLNPRPVKGLNDANKIKPNAQVRNPATMKIQVATAEEVDEEAEEIFFLGCLMGFVMGLCLWLYVTYVLQRRQQMHQQVARQMATMNALCQHTGEIPFAARNTPLLVHLVVHHVLPQHTSPQYTLHPQVASKTAVETQTIEPHETD
jgi:hypothetical protein